jgi:hypothetical protein
MLKRKIAACRLNKMGKPKKGGRLYYNEDLDMCVKRGGIKNYQITDRIVNSESGPFFGDRKGVYKDTPLNRKFDRVGRPYQRSGVRAIKRKSFKYTGRLSKPNPWAMAVKMAYKNLNLTEFKPLRKGEPLYEEAMQIYLR